MHTHQPNLQMPLKEAVTDRYIGRFAPSPTGPLHQGSLVTAVASYLDARANRGQWLVRIEDVDTTRAVPGMANHQLQTLENFGFEWDGPVVYQSQRSEFYRDALQKLQRAKRTYACNCSRSQIQALVGQRGHAQTHNQDIIYPGTCRDKNFAFEAFKTAMRFALPNPEILSNFNQWTDRFAGDQYGHLQTDTGDFVLLRSDAIFSYQIAVVVDDALQNVTDIVRGADLLSNTPRQRLLSNALGYQPLRYLHVPLVLNAGGQKLSKQNGAKPLGTVHLTAQLNEAMVHLGFNPIQADTVCEFWKQAIPAWMKRFKPL